MGHDPLQLLARNLGPTRDANWRTEVRATRWDAEAEGRFLVRVRELLQILMALPTDPDG